MSREDRTRRATNTDSLRANPYAQAKLTFIDFEGTTSTSVEEVAAELPAPKVGARPVSSQSRDLIAPDQLLTDRDVANRYRVQKQTVWRWLRSQKASPNLSRSRARPVGPAMNLMSMNVRQRKLADEPVRAEATPQFVPH